MKGADWFRKVAVGESAAGSGLGSETSRRNSALSCSGIAAGVGGAGFNACLDNELAVHSARDFIGKVIKRIFADLMHS